jgi:voltage-gated potassium channel
MNRWYRIQILKKLLLPFLMLLLLMFTGTAGYILIEGYSFLEAIYMTTITVASIGYGEVKPLSDNGRIFTIFLIILNVGILTLFITMVTRFIIDGDFIRQYKLYKMHSTIQQLHDHVIICGYGRNGREAAHVLNNNNIPFVVIEEKDHEGENEFRLMHFLKGNAMNDETLQEAGLAKAKALIITLPNDADNLFLVLTAKQYNPRIKIISRASKDSSVSKLKIAGATNVIMPDKIGGAHMATLVMNPDVVELLSLMTLRNNERFRVQELEVRNSSTLGQIDVWKNTGCTVLGIKNNKDYMLNPPAEQALSSGDRLIVMGSDEQIANAKKMI